MSHTFGKISQTAAWLLECSHSHWERVGVGRRGKKYHIDIVRVSSTKRRGSGIKDLENGLKLSDSGADSSMSAQPGDCRNSHKPLVVDSLGITGRYVKA